MVLGAGLVSAVIINKKRSNYKTRLDKLQQKLKKKPLSSLTVYQVPVKQIWCLVLLILFILIYIHFQHSIIHELQSTHKHKHKHKHTHNETAIKPIIINSSHKVYQYQYEYEYKNGEQFYISTDGIENGECQTISHAVFWIKVLFCIFGLFILSNLGWKVVRVDCRSIRIQQFRRFMMCEKKVIHMGTMGKWKIFITAAGTQKFSHNNSHYMISLIDQKSQKIQILKRSHIFQARKTIIEMGSVLGFTPQLKIQ